MSINEERNRLLQALARMVVAGEALLTKAQEAGLVASGRVGGSEKAELEGALAEARTLLSSMSAREPVVVEVMGRDGIVTTRVET